MSGPTAPSVLRSRFDHDGYVVVPGFYGDEQLSELEDELARYIRDVVPKLPAGSAFYQDRARPETLKQLQHMGADPYFDAIRGNPLWCRLAEELLGEACSPQEPEWFNKPPGTQHETPPHQDNFYFCLHPSQVLTMWLALDDVDEENGCLRYVPGSHRRGIRSHSRTSVVGFSQGISDYSAADRQSEVAVPLRRGDLVTHHGEMIHRADANRSMARSRRAFAMVFRAERCVRDEAAYSRYLNSLQAQHTEVGLV